jgi:hypothetical protein
MLKNICMGGVILVVLSIYSCHSARKAGIHPMKVAF